MDLLDTPSQFDASPSQTESPRPQAARRPWYKRAMHLVRRGHLYLGLFLLPWAILYGITGFLFNHPTAFSDRNTASFGAASLVGSAFLPGPTPASIAEQVVAGLNTRSGSLTTYSLVDPESVKYGPRSLAFATATLEDGRKVSLLFDVVYGSGTVREQPNTPPPAPAKPAPFAIQSGRGGSTGTGRGGRNANTNAPAANPLTVPNPLHERVQAAIPAALAATGFPAAIESVVTSVPDLIFTLQDAEGQVWRVNYNAMKGTVSGTVAEQKPASESLSVRRFLLRLHTAHGYPAEGGSKWWWAVIVDAMAFVMVFWGASGLLMWWQIKATRRIGIPILISSAVTATVLTMGMYALLTAP